MSSVGWAKAKAAQKLQVPAETIRIIRDNTTVCRRDGTKLFDVLGTRNKLYAVATERVADEKG